MPALCTIEISRIPSGYRARAIALGLCGHGRDEEDALESLQDSITAWATSLHRMGRLVRTLKHRGVDFDQNDAIVTLRMAPLPPVEVRESQVTAEVPTITTP